MKIHFTQPPVSTHQAFVSFYTQYAPNLWGLILKAGLPASQSEDILIKTFLRAWQHPRRHTVGEPHVLTWLLGLAHAEGMPSGPLNAVFFPS